MIRIILVLCVCITISACMMLGRNKSEDIEGQSFTECTIVSEHKDKIALRHYAKGNPNLVIIAHGFFNSKDTVTFSEMAGTFAKDFDVISFDFSGHGKSEGVFSWTANEDVDLRAIIEYGKEFGYQKIGLIGFSLGAAISIIEVSSKHNVDSLIAVSAPTDFWEINFHFWEREMLQDLKANLGPKGKGKGIRPGNPFRDKIAPIDVVGKISPIPVLFLHGEDDWLIKAHHSEKLYEKAREPKRLEVIEEVGHAEKIFDEISDSFYELCRDWFRETL